MIEDPQEELLRSLHQALSVIADEVGIHAANIRGHQQNASQIARTLAQMMKLSEAETECIRVAAMLHDIGFLRVPHGILSKPGRLTAEEMALVRQHSQHGADILKPIEFPWPIARIVLQHHERMDGSGYPNKLEGNDILLEARVIAVADVMESMTADRPWRRAFSEEEALAEIQGGNFRLYDPFVVETCVELYTKQRYRLDPEYYGRD